MKTAKFVLIVLMLFLVGILNASCKLYEQNENTVVDFDSSPKQSTAEGMSYADSPYSAEADSQIILPIRERPVEPPKPPEPKGKTIVRISAVGDIMVHKPQIDSAAQSDGSFDFKPVFEHIKPYLEIADIALGNIETTISTPERGFYGFPRFRSPKEVVEALKYAGFDVITTSNNHILDGFEFGLEHTLNTLDEYGLKHTGAARTPKERETLLIIDKNDIKIAVLAYTYGTNGMEAAIDKDRLQYMVTYIHEIDKIKADITRARELGADFVIVCLHWGAEYQRKQNREQERVAETLIGAGVDIIFGSHPHVLQPIVKKTVSKEGLEQREGLVVYSMGNFISNQRKRFRDSGMIVNVTIVKDHDTGKVYIDELTYVPTWVNRYSKDERLHYRILPVGKSLDTGLYDEAHARLVEVWSETTEHIGDFEAIR